MQTLLDSHSHGLVVQMDAVCIVFFLTLQQHSCMKAHYILSLHNRVPIDSKYVTEFWKTVDIRTTVLL